MTNERDTEFTEVEIQLGLAAAPVTPSANLRANLMAQIAVTPQFAPLENDEPLEESDAEQGDAEEGDAGEIAPQPDVRRFDTPTVGPTEAKAKARWMSRAVISVTSLAAAAALVIGGGVVYNNVIVPQQQYAQLAEADDRQEAVAEIAGGGTARLEWSNELLTSALHVEGLEPLPADKVYELWYIGEDGPRPAGTFTVGDDGVAREVLEGSMQAGDIVGVTIEPKGGSELPTTDPIVAFQSA